MRNALFTNTFIASILAAVVSSTFIVESASAGIRSGNSANAAAAADNDQFEKLILQNSIVATTGQLMNAKYNGKCTIPTDAKDVHWMCLGALSPVSVPTIKQSYCGFFVDIVCPGETAKIHGTKVSYFLQMPTGEKTEVKSTDPVIAFDSVTLEKRP